MSIIQGTGFEPGISAHRDCILLRQINLTTDSNFHLFEWSVLKSWIFFEIQTQDNLTILKLFGCVVCSAPLPFFKHFQSSFEIVCSFTSNYSFDPQWVYSDHKGSSVAAVWSHGCFFSTSTIRTTQFSSKLFTTFASVLYHYSNTLSCASGL